SSFMLEDMGAIDSSGAIATFCGGPTTLDGALSSPITLGGETPRSMMVTVSSAGFGGNVFTPLTSTALASLAETASCAAASEGNNGTIRRGAARPLSREMGRGMGIPPTHVLMESRARAKRAMKRYQRIPIFLG